MERILVTAWTCHLALVLCPALAITTSPRPPQLINCVFVERANVTCHWEAGDILAKNYTLKVEKMSSTPNPTSTLYTCTTSENSCTAITESTTRITYCITVVAHTFSQDVSSERRCHSGRIEVKLNPVKLDSIKPVRGRPQCLNVTWISTSSQFPVRANESIFLKSQIEFTAQGQFNIQVENVTSRSKSIMVCLFRPDTSYTVRLRHSFKDPSRSPWSQWSNAQHGRTGEDAPSAAPPFWRRVIQTDTKGRRLVLLHWKPLPHRLANGRVLFFNVTCQTESAQVLSDHGNCSHLNHTSTSCSLHLPEGRCSCKLTASTSAGTSPEARIWLLGASEAEPPHPINITATPLDDNSLDVRWMSPTDRSPSSFVVDWFAVKQTEKNNNIPYWEKLNSSCKSLVITEGVKPMERYVVSVSALYGEQVTGQDETVVYTRQGVPTAGPKEVQVQQITGHTAEIVWSPVPVELLRGFIRNYTISYSKENQKVKKVLVPGDVHYCSLKNLSPGNYIIYVQANTDAGPGKEAGFTKIHIDEGPDEMSTVMYTLLPIMGAALVLTLIACLAQNKMVKQKLCQDVPDPSDSSLADWTPKTTLEDIKWPVITEMTEIKYSEVALLGESEPQNSRPDEDLTYHSCDLQTNSSPCYSPQSVSQTQTAQKTTQPVRKCFARAETTSSADLSSCPSIYSSVLCSQMPPSPPTLLLDSIYQTNHWQRSTASVNDVNLQLGGDSEPPASPQSATRAHSPLSEPDEPKTFRYSLQQHQSPVCFSDFSSFSHSSVLLSHPAEVTSPQDPFSQSIYKSVPVLQSPFPQSLFVDFSYCPLKCDPDPYISSINHQ